MKDVLKTMWKIVSTTSKAQWRNAPIVKLMTLILNIWFWYGIIKGPKTWKSISRRWLIALVISIPIGIYYFASGQYTKVRDGIQKDLEEALK